MPPPPTEAPYPSGVRRRVRPPPVPGAEPGSRSQLCRRQPPAPRSRPRRPRAHREVRFAPSRRVSAEPPPGRRRARGAGRGRGCRGRRRGAAARGRPGRTAAASAAAAAAAAVFSAARPPPGSRRPASLTREPEDSAPMIVQCLSAARGLHRYLQGAWAPWPWAGRGPGRGPCGRPGRRSPTTPLRRSADPPSPRPARSTPGTPGARRGGPPSLPPLPRGAVRAPLFGAASAAARGAQGDGPGEEIIDLAPTQGRRPVFKSAAAVDSGKAVFICATHTHLACKSCNGHTR